jgi:hypothetical protein
MITRAQLEQARARARGYLARAGIVHTARAAA